MSIRRSEWGDLAGMAIESAAAARANAQAKNGSEAESVTVFFSKLRRSGRLFMPSMRTIATATIAGAMLASAASAAGANDKYAAFVIDANTGKTLYARNADAPRYPASLTKMMTLYILFEELRAGRIHMKTAFTVSKNASVQAPSKLGLKPGSTIRVQDAMGALITKSANDVAMVVAENISGSEARFAQRMTSTARRLGMSRTTFRNPHGLPNKAQRTTARDMVTLGRALQQHFPSYYKNFSTRVFTYRGRRYANHNRLLGRVRGVDGIKTGYTRASGYNLVSSARLDGRHVVAVVMGGKSGRSRNAHMTKLIQTYLPKARRGKLNNSALIAKGTAPASNQQASLKDAPAPKAKPQQTEITTASIAPPARASTVAVQKVKTERIAYNAYVNKPAAEEKKATTEAVGTSSVMPRPGWQIQIGAMPSKGAANDLIERARSSGGSALSKRNGYTMTVDKNGTTLYRARFTGFPSKSSAASACAVLKKRKFACYTIHE